MISERRNKTRGVSCDPSPWLGFKDIEKFNPDCYLEWIGRTVQQVDAAFTTKVDPGVQCTGLVNEVFNYYLSEMKDEELFEKLWEEFNELSADKECTSNTQSESEGRRRLIQTNNNLEERNLKGAGGGTVAAAAASGADSGDGEGDESLTLRQMAGTFLLHGILSGIAIIIGIISVFQKNAITSTHRAKTVDESSEQSVDQRLDSLQKSQMEVSNQMAMILTRLNSIQEKLDNDEFRSANADPADSGAVAKVRSFFKGQA